MATHQFSDLQLFFAHVCFQENYRKLSIVRGTIAVVIDLKKCYRKQNYRDTAMSRPIVTPLRELQENG